MPSATINDPHKTCDDFARKKLPLNALMIVYHLCSTLNMHKTFSFLPTMHIASVEFSFARENFVSRFEKFVCLLESPLRVRLFGWIIKFHWSHIKIISANDKLFADICNTYLLLTFAKFLLIMPPNGSKLLNRFIWLVYLCMRKQFSHQIGAINNFSMS